MLVQGEDAPSIPAEFTNEFQSLEEIRYHVILHLHHEGFLTLSRTATP